MTLSKRYSRNIKNNLSFYICVCILTAIVVVLYLDFAAAAIKVGNDIDCFYDRFKVENAQFTVMKEISEEQIKLLEEKYDIILEKQRYKDFTINYCGEKENSDEDESEREFELRILSVPKKINLYVKSDGDVLSEEPASSVEDGKIIINTGLAEGNDLKIGDMIEVGRESFEYAGNFERPDYLFPIKETTDTFAIRSEFGIALISDDDFEKTEGEAKEYYVIRYNKDNESEVRKKVNEEYGMLTYLKADTNTRINTPLTEVEETVNLMNISLVVLVIFITVIISVVIGRKIRNDRKQIGVLIALGYRKKELKKHYAVYGILLGLIGTILGVILSYVMVDMMIENLFHKIEKVPTHYSISVWNILLTILVPTVMYFISVYRSAGKVMKDDVITMISGRSHGSKAAKLRMKKSGLSVKMKYKLRQIFGKAGRSIIVIIGLAMGGMLYCFCLACIDSMDSYVNNTVDRIGTFNYEYFMKTAEFGEPEKGNAILGVSYEVKDREDILMLLGIDSPDMINFNDPDGNALKFEEGRYYITSMASLAFDKEIGDEITIVDPITLNEYTVKITDVVKNDSQAAIYCSRKDAVELLDKEFPGDDLPYNMIMSDEPIGIDEDKLVKTITKQSLADQIEEVKSGMEKMMGMINIFAIIICIVVVYMMVSVLVSESKASISMLKVLGYRNKEINSMVLNVYHLLVPIAIILSFILGFFGTKAVFTANVSVYKTYLETCIYPISVIKMSLLVLGSYAGSLFLLRGKAGKVDLVESLKDNRE